MAGTGGLLRNCSVRKIKNFFIKTQCSSIKISNILCCILSVLKCPYKSYILDGAFTILQNIYLMRRTSWFLWDDKLDSIKRTLALLVHKCPRMLLSDHSKLKGEALQILWTTWRGMGWVGSSWLVEEPKKYFLCQLDVVFSAVLTWQKCFLK